MKTVLIPTDFKTESLNSIPELLKKMYPEQLNIMLVHILDITDSIQELLMLSKRSAEYRHVPEAFYKRCTELKKNNPERIGNIRVEFFYGSTVAVFNNLLDANDVDSVVKLNNYNYNEITQNSIDPSRLISRCNRPIIYVDCNPVFEYIMQKSAPTVKTKLVTNQV